MDARFNTRLIEGVRTRGRKRSASSPQGPHVERTHSFHKKAGLIVIPLLLASPVLSSACQVLSVQTLLDLKASGLADIRPHAPIGHEVGTDKDTSMAAPDGIYDVQRAVKLLTRGPK